MLNQAGYSNMLASWSTRPAGSLLTPLLLVLSVLASSAVGVSSSGCGNANHTTPNNTAVTQQVGNVARQFYVRLPPAYDARRPHRLVLTLHAVFTNGGEVHDGRGMYEGQPHYGLSALDSEADTIFVSPDGLEHDWHDRGGEDVLFLDAVLARLEADLCVDTRRRFATGFNVGGAMSGALACARPDRFRAVAVLSGGPTAGACDDRNRTSPVAFYAQHSGTDRLMPFDRAIEMRNRFVRGNGCVAPGDPATEPAFASPNGTHVARDFEGCREGFPVRWVLFDGGHRPFPQDPGAIASWTPGEVWRFFAQFS